MKQRHWFLYILVVGAALVAVAGVFGFQLWRNPPQDRRELQRIRLLCAQIALEAPGYSPGSPFDALAARERLEKLDTIQRARLAIYDRNGKLLADSRWNRASPLPSWAYFAGRGSDAKPAYTDAVGAEWLIAYMPSEGEAILLVAAPRPTLSISSILRDEAMVMLLRAELIVFLLAVLVIVWAHRRAGPSLASGKRSDAAEVGNMSTLKKN